MSANALKASLLERADVPAVFSTAPKFNLNTWLRAAHRAKYEAMTPEAQMLHDRLDGSLVVVEPLECVDGFQISVQASSSHYCTPREAHWPWVEVECGYPSQDAPELEEWKDGDDSDGESVFAYVPAHVVEALIASHGGVK